MAYTVQVNGTFVFTDTSTTLQIEGLQLDLRKIETLEEWNTTLYAIACQALGQLMMKPARPAQPASPIPTHGSVVSEFGEQFRRQQEDIAERTRQLQDNLGKQHDQLLRTYADTAQAFGVQPGKLQPG
jgi:hypothetical protein